MKRSRVYTRKRRSQGGQYSDNRERKGGGGGGRGERRGEQREERRRKRRRRGGGEEGEKAEEKKKKRSVKIREPLSEVRNNRHCGVSGAPCVGEAIYQPATKHSRTGEREHLEMNIVETS